MTIPFKTTLAVCIASLVLGSCKPKPVTWTYHTVQNMYKIETPDFLTEELSLNKEASFQYANKIDEFYCIVISENKQTYLDSGYILQDLDAYSKTILDQYKTSMGVKVIQTRPIRIGDTKAILSTFEKTMPSPLGTDVEMTMEYVITEGKKGIYQIMVWTLKDRKEKYANDFKRIIGSFRELP